MNTHTKKLYKSDKDSIVWGILGGIGEYFDIDPTILRLGFIIIVLVSGIFPGIIAYIIAYFIIPEKPAKSHESEVDSQQKAKEDVKTTKYEMSELKVLDITNEEKEKFAPGERPTPNVVSELVIPEDIGELKKPNWPEVSKQKEQKTETTHIDLLLTEEKRVNLNDVMEK